MGTKERQQRWRHRQRNRLRWLSVTVPEYSITEAIHRNILLPDEADTNTVMDASYAAEVSDRAIKYLISVGTLAPEQRVSGRQILREVSKSIEQFARTDNP
jgi:hypothetical protein